MPTRRKKGDGETVNSDGSKPRCLLQLDYKQEVVLPEFSDQYSA